LKRWNDEKAKSLYVAGKHYPKNKFEWLAEDVDCPNMNRLTNKHFLTEDLCTICGGVGKIQRVELFYEGE